MRLGGEPIGRWGIALLAVTGIAGLILGVHGWSARGSGAAPGIAGSSPAPASARASSPASSPAQAGPPASASPSAAGPGPLLSSEPYANSAFLIWPGQPSAAARQALTGITVKVRRVGSGISVTASAAGQGASPPRVFQHGARVYIIEGSMGDDSGNSDYSLGDDGLVVTDTQGRVIQ